MLSGPRPGVQAGVWADSSRNDEQELLIGELLDGWYGDPDVQRCAETVGQLACRSRINGIEVREAAPSNEAAAVFAVLLGLDRALCHAHPGQRGPSMDGMSAVALRYLRTGHLNTRRVPGALLPRNSPFDETGTTLGRVFVSVVRVPEAEWIGMRLRRVPPYLDVGRRTGNDVMRVGFVPLLAPDDLALSVVSTRAGEPPGFRLAPRDTPHLRQRMRAVLGLLDGSGVTIAVFPDHALSADLLAHWQELVRSVPAPAGSALKWIMAGGGAVAGDPASPRRAVMLDRDLGEVVLEQEKLVPSRLDGCRLTIRGIEGGELTEEGPLGSRLSLVDSSLGRVGILAGGCPEDVKPLLRHVSHLFRAGLPHPADGSLVVSCGLLLSGPERADPLGQATASLPRGDPRESDAEGASLDVFDPDELALTSITPGPRDGWLHIASSAPGEAAEAAAELRRLQRTRVAGPAGPLRDEAERAEACLAGTRLPHGQRQASNALGLIARISAARGHLSIARDAVNRAISVARSDGAEFLEARARVIGCQLRWLGGQPLSAVAEQASAELEWAESRGYRELGLAALGLLAQARALLGDGASAGELIRRANLLGEALILGQDNAELAAQDAAAAATTLVAAGDLDTAAAVLDRGDRALRRIGAAQSRPALLAQAARVRYGMGAWREGLELLETCARLAAPDDVVVQAALRGVRALLFAYQGDHFEAEELARSAVRASDWSECLAVQAQARADLATVLMHANRDKDAALPAARALSLYELREDVVSAAVLRGLIPYQPPADDWPVRVEAWVMAAEPSLVAGQAASLGIRLHAEPGWSAAFSGPQPDDVLVTLLASGEATVQPGSLRMQLPRAGSTSPAVVEVTPRSAMPLRLHLLVNLYKEGTLLKELGVTIPVNPPEPRYASYGD